MRKKTDLAWAAGFIDGEGCIIIRKSKAHGRHLVPRYSPVLTVVNTNLPALQRLQVIIGGKIFVHYHPDKARTKCWKISCSDNIARAAVEAVLPYLVIKRTEAETMLRFFEIPKGQRGIKTPSNIVAFREDSYIQLRKLKSRKNNLLLGNPDYAPHVGSG